jgi:hypothetical protein
MHRNRQLTGLDRALLNCEFCITQPPILVPIVWDCADTEPEKFTKCLNTAYPLRVINHHDGGCGDRPENSPSLSMMILCYVAPAGVALAAPLVFGTGRKYTSVVKQKLKSYSLKLTRMMVSTRGNSTVFENRFTNHISS